MKLMIKLLRIIFERILDATVIIAGILIVFVVLSVNVAIASRYFFGQPIGWVIEICSYVLLYVTFLVSAWVLKQEGHTIIDIVIERFNPKSQSVLNIITSIVCVFVCLILTFYGIKVSLHLYQTGYMTISLLELPKAPIIAIIPFGSFLLMLQFIRRIYGYLENMKEPGSRKGVPKPIQDL